VTDPSPLERWQARVKRDLRGADFSRALVHEAVDGLRTQPLYTRADREGLDLSGPAGAFPWTPTDADVRTWQLTFTVTDGQDADSTTVSVEVTPSGDTNNTLKAGTESPGCDCSTTQGRPSSMLWLLAALGLGWALRSRPESYGRR